MWPLLSSMSHIRIIQSFLFMRSKHSYFQLYVIDYSNIKIDQKWTLISDSIILNVYFTASSFNIMEWKVKLISFTFVHSSCSSYHYRYIIKMIFSTFLLFGTKISKIKSQWHLIKNSYFCLASCGTLASSYPFDLKLQDIRDKSLTMILAIEKVLEDLVIKQSNSLFVSEQTTIQFHNGLKPSELLHELLQFMSNQTTVTFVIDSVEHEHTTFHNHLLIIDGYESFR